MIECCLQAAFLGERGLTDCDFSIRVLDCMFFTSFVAERGPPWRLCDVWDELYSNLSEQLKQEAQDHSESPSYRSNHKKSK